MNTIKRFSSSATFVLFFTLLAHGQWAGVADYPSTPTDGAFSFTINGTPYVGGGLAATYVASFDAKTNMWSATTAVPSPGGILAWAFSFSVNGKGYVTGGSYASASDLTDETYEFDPVAKTWTKKADFPTGPRDAGFAFSIGDKGYVGGGFDGQFIHGDMYEYEPALDKWTQMADFPGGAIIFPVSFVIDGYAYVGTGGKGGFTDNEIQGFWKYDPQMNSWTKIADFPGDKRQAAVAFAVGGKGYVGGGMSGYNTIRQDFWEYDPASNTWTKLANGDYPESAVAWSVAFAVENEAFVGTGASLPDFNFSNKFYKYSFPTSGIEAKRPGNSFKLYPLPATDVLNISTAEGEKIQGLLITDYCGKEVVRLENRHAQNIQVQVGSLAKGAYIVRLQTDYGYASRLFIKD